MHFNHHHQDAVSRTVSLVALILAVIQVIIGFEPINILIEAKDHHHGKVASETDPDQQQQLLTPASSSPSQFIVNHNNNNGTVPDGVMPDDGIIIMGNRELHLMAYGGIGVCVFFVWFRCFSKNFPVVQNLCRKSSQALLSMFKKLSLHHCATKLRTRSNYEVIGDDLDTECTINAKAINRLGNEDDDYEKTDEGGSPERRNSRTIEWTLAHLKSANSLYRAI